MTRKIVGIADDHHDHGDQKSATSPQFHEPVVIMPQVGIHEPRWSP
jgi:hypothetical protein